MSDYDAYRLANEATTVQWQGRPAVSDERCPECGSRCSKGCGCRFHDTAPAADDCPGNCPAHDARLTGGET